MTECKRKAKKITTSDTCKRCNNAKEDALHVLRDCPLIKPLWESMLKTEHWHRFFSMNIDEWISFNLSKAANKMLNGSWNSRTLRGRISSMLGLASFSLAPGC
ncbi:putative non-LTR retroelement reverse transcriptase [Senna tora]|uniref:Putative non-LTR retroelement reverse transcriptase n=1 Tax=Senna tora TaxID=362788 RepID=A0A834TK37_9FABA|nr:putative non-LTR retroelement reverse transcriptase [Senna tora]